MYKYFSALIVTLLFPLQINGQVSESTEFSLLTVAHGRDAYNIFGHTGLRMYDTVQEIDEVYNYGTFDIDTDNFEITFLRGRLNYRIAKQSYKTFLRVYYQEGRAVTEQKLNLDQPSKEKLYSYIRNNYKPENRNYLYDFFFDNCATRVRDIFETELSGSEYFGLSSRHVTYRQLLDEYLQGLDWTDFGIDLIIGSIADAKADHRGAMFLPDYLHDYTEKIQYVDETGNAVKLVKSDELILPLDFIKHQAYFITPLLLFSLLAFIELLIFIFYKKLNRPNRIIRMYDFLGYIAISTVSIVIMFMWFATDHDACVDNYNLMWANPLFLVLTGTILFSKQSSRVTFLVSVFLIITLLLWTTIPQQFHIAVLPIIIMLLLKNLRKMLYVGVSDNLA